LSQKILRDATLYRVLLAVDDDLAAQVHTAGCPCGGRLHSARYRRKPRGSLALLPPGYRWRQSYCCERDGCRRRRTPPSVRFLGRRVYLGAVVVLVSALVHGPSPSRLRRLKALVGVSRRTVERWRRWWLSTFVASPVWEDTRARLINVAVARLPASLLERFAGEEMERLRRSLALLSPLTTRSCAGWSPLFEGR
tara:strand:+ start:3127 stop:3711 length:585 start_codon:yes stop_codon:yes gene_type:complete